MHSLTFFPFLEALQEQVNEISSLLKTIVKGKNREANSQDLIIDWSNLDINDINEINEINPKTSRSATGSSKNTVLSSVKQPARLEIQRGRSELRKDRSNRSRFISERTRSRTKPRNDSNWSFSSSSSSFSSSSSPSPERLYIFYEDLDKELRIALRVTIFHFN